MNIDTLSIPATSTKKTRKPWDVFDEEILPYLTAEALYGDLNKLKKSREKWQACCPFHDDHKPSFSINTFSLTWYCHACGVGGGPVQYLQKRYSFSWMEAAKKIAELAEIDPAILETWRDEWSDKDFSHHNERERKFSLFEAFNDHAVKALLADRGVDAREFLLQRGFSNSDLPSLGLGLYPDPTDIKTVLTSLGFSDDEINESGLVTDNRWSKRLVCPWRDSRGRIGTFFARNVYSANGEEPKYLYLNGARKPGLFGLHQALRNNSRYVSLVVVEGPLDVVLLRSKGFKNVVALGGSGSLLTTKTLNYLAKRNVHSITLALDNDSSGEAGLTSALENARKAGHAVRVYVVDPVGLGDAKDPGEFVKKHGVDPFREILKGRVPGNTHHGLRLLEDTMKIHPSENHREAVEVTLDFAVDLPKDAVLDREDLLNRIAERTNYPLDDLRGLLTDRITSRIRANNNRLFDESLKDARDEFQEGIEPVQIMQDLESAYASLEFNAEEPLPPFAVDYLDRESTKLTAGLSSGWRSLDRLDVEFHPGELIIIGSRTGHGKTSIAVNLIVNWMLEHCNEGGRILFYSSEEPTVRIYHRILSCLTAIFNREDTKRWSMNDVRDYLRDPSSRNVWPDPLALEKAKDMVRGWERKLLVVYKPTWTAEEIDSHARSFSESNPSTAILIDYLQRIPPPATTYGRRDIEISTVARRFKKLAVDLNVPLVIGAQVNRQAITDPGKTLAGKDYFDQETQQILRSRRPQLHHLREGGSEQEADIVLGIMNYRADYMTEMYAEEDSFDGSDDSQSFPMVTRIDVGVLKNRYGPTGRWIPLAFEGRFGYVRDPGPGEVLA